MAVFHRIGVGQIQILLLFKDRLKSAEYRVIALVEIMYQAGIGHDIKGVFEFFVIYDTENR